jgi:hypothetical protein
MRQCAISFISCALCPCDNGFYRCLAVNNISQVHRCVYKRTLTHISQLWIFSLIFKIFQINRPHPCLSYRHPITDDYGQYHVCHPDNVPLWYHCHLSCLSSCPFIMLFHQYKCLRHTAKPASPPFQCAGAIGASAIYNEYINLFCFCLKGVLHIRLSLLW